MLKTVSPHRTCQSVRVERNSFGAACQALEVLLKRWDDITLLQNHSTNPSVIYFTFGANYSKISRTILSQSYLTSEPLRNNLSQRHRFLSRQCRVISAISLVRLHEADNATLFDIIYYLRRRSKTLSRPVQSLYGRP